MKPMLRQLRDVARPRVSLPSWTPASGPAAAQDTRRCRLSEALQLTANIADAGNGILLSEFQVRLMKRATAVAADAMLGPAATPSLRLLVRRALRAAVAMASTATFLIKLWALAASLGHVDLMHDVQADAELVSAVDTILLPTVPPSLLVRGPLFMLSVMAYWLNLSTTTVHLSCDELDLITDAETVLDLAISGPCLMESGRGLMRVAAALGRCQDEQHGSAAGEGAALGGAGPGDCSQDR